MKLVSIKEIAELTKVKEKTLYGWASRGLIPCHKLNGLLRFSLEEIKQWVEDSRVAPPPAGRPRCRTVGGTEMRGAVKRIVASCQAQRYDPPKKGNQTSQARKGGI